MVQSQLPATGHQYGQFASATNTATAASLVDPTTCLSAADYQTALGAGYLGMAQPAATGQLTAGLGAAASAPGLTSTPQSQQTMLMALQQQVALQHQQAALAHSLQNQAHSAAAAQAHSAAAQVKPLDIAQATLPSVSSTAGAASTSPVDAVIKQQIATPSSQLTPPHSSPSDTTTPVNLMPNGDLSQTGDANQVSLYTYFFPLSKYYLPTNLLYNLG